MNVNKAREYYSAYYEGTLEPGLKQAFERAMNESAQIQSEYRAFAKTVEAINGLQDEEIEIPFDLHERISARLDKDVWERKQKAGSSWFGRWWQTMALGGVAVLAVVGSLVTIFNPNRNFQQSQAGLVATAHAVPLVSLKGQELLIQADPTPGEKLTVRQEDGTSDLASYDLGSTKVRSPLHNSSTTPALFTISTSKTTVYVVLPGTDSTEPSKGAGNTVQLAKALAAAYHVPVMLDSIRGAGEVRWTMSGKSVDDAVATKLEGHKVILTKQEGMLKLTDAGD